MYAKYKPPLKNNLLPKTLNSKIFLNGKPILISNEFEFSGSKFENSAVEGSQNQMNQSESS
jgi:hypothetical protein